MSKAKGSSPHTPPEGMRINPFFQTPFMVFSAIKDGKIGCVASRILALAIIADHGYGKGLKLGIDRVIAGTKCGRKTAINGLKALVDNGFLVKIDEHRGLYKLGPLFDKFIPIEEIVTADDVRDGEDMPQSRVESESHANRLFAIWKELMGADQGEFDSEARKRADKWAVKRIEAGADPVSDFTTATQYFLEHGQAVPLPDNKPRNPQNYTFKGFFKISTMFLKLANSAEGKPIAIDSNTHLSNPGAAKPHAEIASTAVPQKYSSFIVGENEDGSFIYDDSEITTVSGLILALEHAFSLIGGNAQLTSPKAREKCAEDLNVFFKDADASRVVRIIRGAKALSRNDDYFTGKPFTYHTARTIFPQVLDVMKESDEDRAEQKRRLENGELKAEYLRSLRNVLNGSVFHFRTLGEPWDSDSKELKRIANSYYRDYGNPAQGDLPQEIVDGLHCLSIMKIIRIPDALLEAVGPKPDEPNFTWCESASFYTDLMEIWHSQDKTVDGLESSMPPKSETVDN